MPAPKNPNVTAAAASRRRIGLETKAADLREAGWLVMSPEEVARRREETRCDFCDDPGRHPGEQCRCLRPCGAAFCWWADNGLMNDADRVRNTTRP